MRIIFLITANLLLLFTLAFQEGMRDDGIFGEKGKKFSYALNKVLYTKKINISGNNRLDYNEVKQTMPMEKSVAWWLMNRNSIEEKLLANPLIESAVLNPCGYSSWGCFNVKISERKPEYIALLGNKPWLIGSDGGFISPLDNILDKKSGFKMAVSDLKDSVMIKGLLEKDYSPDVLQAKINFLSQAISTIEKKIKLKVKEAEVNSDSEIAVKFKGHDFGARFTFDDASIAKIEDQSQRLKKIMGEYSNRLDEIKEIDLAFEHIAVVKKTEIKKS
jgi:hypothetical protein